VGGSVQGGIVGRRRNVAARIELIIGQLAIAGGFLQLAARRLDKKKNRLVKSQRMQQRVTLDHNSRAAMPFTLVSEGELDFGADPKRPLRQKADPLRRPSNLILNQLD
jgi:hypothetical protein